MKKGKKFKYLDGNEIGHYYLPDITDKMLLYIMQRIIDSPKKRVIIKKSE